MIYTSYYEGYRGDKGVSISVGPPEGFTGARYTDLNPTWDMVNRFNDDESYTVKRYNRDYQAILDKLNPHQVYQDLDGMVLLCYGAPGKHCHRHLVAEWLRSYGYAAEELDVTHNGGSR